MGTRADFYLGRGADAEWLGSIGWDGYPGGIDPLLLRCRDERAWRSLVADYLAKRDDGTKPEDGWPWPWEDSNTTDYAYAFDEGRVWGSCFGGPWFKADEPEPEADDEKHWDDKGNRLNPMPFPNMKHRQKTTFGKRSGLLVLGGQP